MSGLERTDEAELVTEPDLAEPATADARTTDAGQAEAAQPDAARTDAARTDAAQTDAAQADGQQAGGEQPGGAEQPVPDEQNSDEQNGAEPVTGRRWWLPASLAAAVVLLIGAGTALEVRAHDLRSRPAATNRALSDTAATTEVIGQVSTALGKVLSYDYTNPGATQQAANQLLTSDAANQYRTLFTALQRKAPGEKLTLSAKVVSAGVTSLHGSTAQLLVFLDQSSTRASDKQSSTSAAQLDITAVRQGSSWKISELLPL